MNEDYQIVKLRGKEYKLIFTTQALIEVKKQFGGIGEMSAQMKGEYEAAASIIAWLIALEANQGIDIENELTGKNEPYITEKYVLYAPPIEFSMAREAAVTALNEGLCGKITPDEDESDGTDEVLNEIKNGKGAVKEKK